LWESKNRQASGERKGKACGGLTRKKKEEEKKRSLTAGGARGEKYSERKKKNGQLFSHAL